MSLICSKCDKEFTREDNFKKHINNLKNPCDFKCIGCGYRASNKRGLYRHKKKCDKYQEIEDTLDSNLTDTPSQKNPNIITNGSNNTNTNNTNNTNNLNNNNNQLLMMSPFDVDHYYQSKEDTYGNKKDILTGLISNGDFLNAMGIMFRESHGNLNKPERHNAYMQTIDSNYVSVFRGVDFNLEPFESVFDRMFTRFTWEMNWAVRSSDRFTETEVDQLNHDINSFRNCGKDNDGARNLIRMELYNNKRIVMNTLKNNIVVPNKEMSIKWLDLANHPQQGHKKLPTLTQIYSSIDSNARNVNENYRVTGIE